MYMIIGLIRSSLLYAFILSLVRGTFSGEFIVTYAGIILITLLLSKIKKDGLTLGELLLEILKHDMLVPLLGIRALALILFGKYLNDSHEPHASLFMSQGIIEGVWGTVLAIYIAVTFLQAF